MSRDKQYIALINSHRWHQLRHAQIVAEPLCEECKKNDRVTVATEVHHRTPVESGRNFEERQRLAYDPANLESLCRECHKAKHIRLHRLAREQAGNQTTYSKDANRARVEKEKDLFNSLFFSD